jgi:hypothetical protein
MPGVKGVVVDRMENANYRVLVEFEYGIDYITVYGDTDKNRMLAGAAIPREDTDAVLKDRTAKVTAVLDAIQSRCGTHAAQQTTPADAASGAGLNR